MLPEIRPKGMKTFFSHRILLYLGLFGLFGSSVSCTTTYDRNGRPVQSVDPGAATAGVVAAGIIGYALANGGKKHHGNRNHYGHHGRHNYYQRPNYRNGYSCR